MLLIISINIITGIIILLLGYKIGERGGQRIINRIFIINIYIILYYIYNIIIKGEERIIKIISWFNDINKIIEINILIDKITIIMTSLIIIISYIIMKYSNWYIPELKFKGILYIFLVSMIVLVSTKEYISIYIGWEWVGISSYILINYWYNNIYNNKAGIKAILYNKIGDIALLLLIVYLYIYYNHSSSSLLSLSNYNYIIPISIGIAAMAKSAQYIMHPWLGDAMAGPTPVSALLHAATMVTAGIVLLYRSILYNNYIWEYILYIGIITIIFGGIASITQNDIKKIIAYSTCSQLGYMFFISLYNNSPINYSLYHLYTHAFFKALLFLTAGIIIHFASSEQDIRKLSLAPSSLPYHLLLFSSLSLLSFPFTSGFYSKEPLILSIHNSSLSYISIFGAFLTIIYSLRLIYKITYSTTSNTVDIFPLYIYLSLLILLFGSIYIGYFSFSYFLVSYSFLLSYNSILPFLPLISIPLFFYLINLRFSSYYISLSIYYIYLIFNKRTFIDSIFNNISYYIISYFYSIYLNLDKGLLEYFGPLGFYKLFLSNNIYILSSFSKLNILLSFFFSLLLLSISLL